MILKSFIQLRDQLSDIAYDNNNFTTLASGVKDSDIKNAFQYDGITASINGSQITFVDAAGSGSPITLSISQLPDHLSDVIPGTSYAISDILTGCSNSGDVYSALSVISQKYSYSERINLTTLNQVIDSATDQNNPNYDIKSLKDQLLATSDDNGFVSSKSWLVCLRTWFDECLKGAQSGSTELDQTAPTVISALYNVVVNAVSAALNVILTALAAVFGPVMIVISSIFNFVFNAVTNYFSAQGEINVNAPNLFTKGVAIASEFQWSGGLQNDTKNDFRINYLDLPSVGFFYWQGNSGPNSLRANAYAQPKYGIEGVYSFIMSDNYMTNAGFTWSTNGFGEFAQVSRNQFIATTPFVCGYAGEFELTANEIGLCSSDIGYYSACVIMSEFVRVLNATPGKLPKYDNSAWTYPYYRWDDNFYNHNASTKMIRAAMYLLRGRYENDIFKYISKNDCISRVADWVALLYDHRSDFSGRWLIDLADGITGASRLLYYPMNPIYTICSNERVQSALNINGLLYEETELDPIGWGTSTYTWHYAQGESPLLANSLPCAFAATYKAFSSSEFITALLLSSVAAISAAFVTLKVSKAMRLKKIKKQTLRSANISDLREEFLADPDNAMKASAYAKEVDKFNRMGKIFGWGSYDAGNAWIDNASGGSSVPNTYPKLNAMSTKIESQEVTIQYLSDRIEYLISLVK